MSIELGYDEAGRVVDRRLVMASGTVVFRAQATYSSTGRVASEVETAGGAPVSRSFTYDEDGELLRVERDGVMVEQYAYDENANRTSSPAGTATYDTQDRLVQQAGVPYSFDADGFLTGRAGDTFEYNARGDLVRAVLAGGAQVTYSYDGFGRRVARTGADGTTQYLYGNPGNPFEVTAVRDAAGGLTSFFYDEEGFLVAFERGGSRFYVGTDQVGTPRVVVNAAGAT